MIEILVFGLSTNQGGIETYLKKIWDNINHQEFHFSFIDITGEKEKPCFFDELHKTGCDFYKITPRNVSRKRNKAELQELFKKHHFDILHYNVNTLSYIMPVKIALQNGCKVLVHSRNAGASYNILTRTFHTVNKIMLQKLDIKRIAVSDLAGKWLFGSSDYDVYHNGIDIDRFTFSEKSRNEIRKKYNCENKFVIGNVGAFAPAKNHKFMVEVFEEIKKIKPNAVLWFVGDGAMREGIERIVHEKKLSDDILFLGIQKDMPAIYSGMDIFWLPSLFEGYPNAVLEAECEGLPCLISDCIPQDVRIMDNSVSFSLSETKQDWASKLFEVYELGHDNREVCAKKVEHMGASIKKEIQKIETLYKDIIKN